MSDLLIRDTSGQWGLVLVDGDAVLTSNRTHVTRLEEVGQRITFRLMTWLRESVYDRSAGIPYPDGIFGHEPVEGVVALLTQEILETEGVDGVSGQPTYDLTDGLLTITAIVQVGDETFDYVLPVSSSLGAA